MSTGLRAEQTEATRGALLAAARELFAARGYAATPIEEIVQRARVTKGALYHHFRDKQDLFKAVFEQLERELVEQINSAAKREERPWERVLAGAQAFLDTCLEPAIQRIVLLDAPSVLGWEMWREIDAQYSLGHVKAALRAAMDEGAIDNQPLDPLAHILIGALNEGALVMARASTAKSARLEIGATVTRLLEGLRSEASPPRTRGLQVSPPQPRRRPLRP
jgi:AcrR family transcriptional regulator